MFGCILTQFLTGRKYGQSLIETLGHGFYGSVAKRSLQKLYKNYPKNYGQTKWGRRSHHHPLPWIRHCKCHMKWCTSQLTWYVYCHWRTGHVTAIVHQRVNFGSKHFFIQLLLTTVIIRKKWGECVRNNRKTRGYSRMYLTLSVPTAWLQRNILIIINGQHKVKKKQEYFCSYVCIIIWARRNSVGLARTDQTRTSRWNSVFTKNQLSLSQWPHDASCRCRWKCCEVHAKLRHWTERV